MTLSAGQIPEGLEMNTQHIPENRKHHAMRERVQQLIDSGWSISGRDPLRIEAAGKVYIVRGGVLING